MWFYNMCPELDLSFISNTKKLNKLKNNIQFQNTFARTLTDALNRYRIDGLPDTISERVVKQSLIWYGSVVFFEREGKPMALPGRATEEFNVNGDPKFGWVHGVNGFNERIRLYIPGADDSTFLREGNNLQSSPQSYKGVYVRENALTFPFVNYAMEYARNIADSMRTLDVCRANAKQPFVVVAEESIVGSVKAFFKERNDNNEYIISTGVFPADKINILPFSTNTENLKNCTDMIEWYWNQWRELCGLNSNSNPDKKERLITAEANANNEATDAQLDKSLEYIQFGLDQVNEVFNLNVTVRPTIEKEDYEDDAFNDVPGISAE